MIRLLLLVVLLLPGVWAAEPSVSTGTTAHHVAQARLFIKKGWYADARQELEAAVAAPEGIRDAEVHLLLAQVCYDVLDVPAALEEARLATGLADKDPELRRQADDLLTWLSSNFGTLEILAPQSGLSSRLQVEMTSTAYDPELKKYANKMALRLKEKTTLPAKVALPAGSWRVNGVDTEVAANGTTSLALPMRALGNQGLASLQVTRLEISTGFGVFFGNRTENLHPSLETQLALTQPIGRTFVALTLDHAFRGYEIDGGDTEHKPGAPAAGVRVGTEVFISGPFALRPALGYRYGLLPGIAFDCDAFDSGLQCAPPGSIAWSDATLYAVTRAHMPYAELSMDYREGGRTNALGVGLRFAVDGVFASLPAQTDANFVSEDLSVSVQATDTAFSAAGLRVLANLSLAF